ncbi:hypothetical protein EJ05DRAFT_341263 [Pseudovirgaria hyperparasitica]|uniref:Uncharacterized protein n=1 Tax=Pseudovirgaria hyperparasitica TaxID=470096 RepID=A0A6A6WBH3_9PEZI|nr:uncharacterized protein EJ05DRAFT_341263 [Pseudovirgaria hyperparasitica]KAF2759310.1 hypothetical protein EJ05DRAFT_341263 [Pseudovirgaria hyperparasitica]
MLLSETVQLSTGLLFTSLSPCRRVVESEKLLNRGQWFVYQIIVCEYSRDTFCLQRSETACDAIWTIDIRLNPDYQRELAPAWRMHSIAHPSTRAARHLLHNLVTGKKKTVTGVHRARPGHKHTAWSLVLNAGRDERSIGLCSSGILLQTSCFFVRVARDER